MKITLLVWLCIAAACAASSPAVARADAGTGRASGRVVDAKGHGVASARVRVSAAGGDDVATATTDAKGAFRVEVAAGDYRFEADADGYSASAGVSASVSAGRETKIKQKLQLRALDQGSVVRGTVFTADGRTVPGAKVLLESVAADSTAGGPAGRPTRREATSDRMGVFAFRVPAGEGRYRITATREGAEPGTAEVSVGGGELTNVSVRLGTAPSVAPRTEGAP